MTEGRPTGARRFAAWALLVVMALQVGVGAIWCVRNYAKVPHYGDTREMLTSAESLELVAGRAIAYPWLLRGVHALTPDAAWGDELAWEVLEVAEPIECHSPAWQGRVQILQLVVVALSIFAALRLLAGGRARATAVCVTLLLVTDPWVLHHVFSLMTDSLALGFVLLFAGACVAYLRDGRRSLLVVLMVSEVAAATLRAEKNLVLLVTVFVAALGVFALVRRGRADARSLRRRSLVLLLVSGVSFPLASAIDELQGRTPLNIPTSALLLHSRVVYPHLEEIYDDLAPETRAVITRADSMLYDRGALAPRRILGKRTEGRPEVLDAITNDMVEVALRRCAGAIALDIVCDLAQYTVPTAAFYWRTAQWSYLDPPPLLMRWRPFEALFARPAFQIHEPAWSRRLEALSATLTALGSIALVVACVRALRRGAGRRLLDPDVALYWIVPFALVLANAAAFSLAADLFEIRYGLPAHVALLAGGYFFLLRFARGVLVPA